MLVLSRFEGERIMIGENTVVQILGFRKNGQIRIGIQAPDNVAIHREEIYQRIHKRSHPLTVDTRKYQR